MDNSLEQQSGHVSMSDNINSVEECSAKPTEVHTDDSNSNLVVTNVKLNDRSKTCLNDAETNVHDKTDTEEHSVVDLLVKLGNDTAVYNISKSLERVRYMINSISVEDMLTFPILPHQKCVTYISQAQKTIKGNQKESVFKFVSSYPSSSIISRKYRVRTGVPVIIIGDVTNIQEDQCSYVFICAYINEFATLHSKATKALGRLGAYNSSADESSDSSDDGSSAVDSSEDSSSSCNESEGENNVNTNKVAKKREDVKPVAVDARNPLVFLEDGAADKLPPVRECDVKVLRQGCIKIGYIMHIHELLISVQGLKDSPALNADTLLFLEDNEDDNSLRSLGFVYEVIGPVDEPVYCITFKEEQSIKKKQVKQGEPVFICPSPEYTHFVFVQDLLKQKGSDASWKNDVEPPEQFIEYSDDEEERLAKQRLKQTSSNESSPNTAVKRKNTEGNNPEKARIYKRKRAVKTVTGSSDSTEVNSEVGSISSMRSQVHPRTSDSHIGSYRATGRGQRKLHAAQLNGEVGNRNIQYLVPPGTSNNHIGAYRVTGRGQQMPHVVQLNGEVSNRRIPSLVSSGTLDNQHNAVGSYHGRDQRVLRTVQINGVETPRMQYTVTRPAGPTAIQQPPRMQQYTPEPAVNRHFLPVPPALYPSNQRFPPPLQQQRAYFNSQSHPRCTAPFPPPQGQFYNPPQ